MTLPRMANGLQPLIDFLLERMYILLEQKSIVSQIADLWCEHRICDRANPALYVCSMICIISSLRTRLALTLDPPTCLRPGPRSIVLEPTPFDRARSGS